MRTFLLLCLLSFSSLHADGKMYRVRETVPANIPYQRAVILHADGLQTMVLQSSYQLPPEAPPSDLAWVIPLPSVPQIGTMHPGLAEEIFRRLDMASAPRVVRLHLDLILLFGLASSLVLLILRTFRRAESVKTRLGDVVFALGVPALLMLIALPGFSRARSKSGVEVLREQQVGVYDVVVLRADEGNPLLAWLRERDFPVDEGDIPVLDAHISRGGCFVAARINPTRAEKPGDLQQDGLAAPLIFQFAAEKPFYPLALTGTGGHETEVLIYLVSDRAWDAGERLALRYAGNPDASWLSVLNNLAMADTSSSENPAFLEGVEKGLTRLHKFKSRLSPGQMREDLVFTPAPGQQDYREKVIRW